MSDSRKDALFRPVEAASQSVARVILLAKEPVAGLVKTRLAETVGAQAAAGCHEAFVRDSIAALAGLPDVAPSLAVTPDAGAPRLRRLAAEAGVAVVEQGDGDLGERMDRLCARAFEDGAGPVVLLGADTPDLPPRFVADAVAALERADVALGPAADGGYYLVAVRAYVPELFRIDAAWGSDAVLAATERRLAAAGRRVVRLERWCDVDRADDLRRLAARLRADPELARRCPHSARVLASLPAALLDDDGGRGGRPPRGPS